MELRASPQTAPPSSPPPTGTGAGSVAVAGLAVSGPDDRRGRLAAPLEPGLLATLRLYIVLSAISPIVAQRMMGRLLGMRGSLLEIIRADVLFFVVLMVYTSWPWLRRKMGGAFLP